MSFSKIIRRELEVAFSKQSQPVWFRILKYILLGSVLYFFWGSKTRWIIFIILFVFAMGMHFWYRYKTQGWTRGYGLWKHDKKNPD
jgi:hypothetical protein